MLEGDYVHIWQFLKSAVWFSSDRYGGGHNPGKEAVPQLFGFRIYLFWSIYLMTVV